ncbi:type II toxin-antitoxin system HicB family antitoxin [Gluconacetobacter tumulisoli]|uniref:HicB-like antitoxin of toxin-antitoxin system domain-containing protein n=1 Tax=Gluconacetobacter tumulisoli TaxID=1286189 RepID=A0A7W4PK00_9PROT|nr:type II toxin-antitoxin system HicB family antitoxin [Gluconacetobacter tumulisoli]MBB2200470.1 hypothetical protein [Gluconacetobacter tumulisoli]
MEKRQKGKVLSSLNRGNDVTAYGVIVPGLPGCLSVGDTLAETTKNAEEVIGTWIETALDADSTLPNRLEMVRANPDHAGDAFAVIV